MIYIVHSFIFIFIASLHMFRIRYILIFVVLLLLGFKIKGELPIESTKYLRAALANADLQPSERKTKYTKYDFAPLWLKTPNFSILGFIGFNYQRIRIKLLSATKDSTHPDTYFIAGKSAIGNNICDFNGTITIRHVRELRNLETRVDEIISPARQEGVLLAEYYQSENKTQAKAGVFTGIMRTNWYINKTGALCYDDISSASDSFCNNQFIGTWMAYSYNKSLHCNWGDYRVSNSGNLDVGTGEFSPDNKYLAQDWQNYSQAWIYGDENIQQQEEKAWW